jgi:hypothetical protein
VHALILAMLSLALGVPAAAQSPRDAALAAFRRKDYARACPLFAEVVRAEPENGAAWADLGVCELKRGRKAESVRASLRAVVHGDDRTRTNAYFNLGLAGVALPFPVPGRCTVWRAPEELNCPQRVEACHVMGPGSGYKALGQNSYATLARCAAGCPRPSVPPELPYGADVPTFYDVTGRSDWTAVLVHQEDVQETFVEMEQEDGSTWRMPGAGPTIATACSVVVLDPCRGRAGLFCTRSEELEQGARRVGRTGHEQRFRVP